MRRDHGMQLTWSFLLQKISMGAEILPAAVEGAGIFGTPFHGAITTTALRCPSQPPCSSLGAGDRPVPQHPSTCPFSEPAPAMALSTGRRGINTATPLLATINESKL